MRLDSAFRDFALKTSRRGIMRICIIYILLAGTVSALQAMPDSTNKASQAAPTRPNIVFILADDLGAKDLSNEGSTYYESPNIDRIAIMGMKFTRGYATCQVCSPSRASILTGKLRKNVPIK